MKRRALVLIGIAAAIVALAAYVVSNQERLRIARLPLTDPSKVAEGFLYCVAHHDQYLAARFARPQVLGLIPWGEKIRGDFVWFGDDHRLFDDTPWSASQVLWFPDGRKAAFGFERDGRGHRWWVTRVKVNP